jgi:tetratricopeptide (TPR) repeat protein
MTVLPHTDYSPGLEKIVARALAKPVKERYQSLEEMRDDLERLVRETAARLAAASAPPAPPPPRPRLSEDERAELLAQVAQARGEGHLQKALTLARRVQEGGGAAAGALVAEIEHAIREKEVEQLSGMALSYAADGDLDLARKIAAKVASLAPGSAKHRELEAYLEEETSRREAGALLATAQEHIALGNLEEALAAAEEALTAQPDHALAREIRERASRVLRARDRATGVGAPAEATAPRARPASPAAAEATLTPVPAPASDPEAARKAQARALTAAALNHFMLSDHVKARRAVEKALALDPTNRKAQELLDILTTLG